MVIFNRLRKKITDQDTSPVSLTAYFTGQVWSENGLSPKGTSTWKGKLLYQSHRPFGWLNAKLYQADLEQMLLVRHQLIDRLVAEELHQGVSQILEIASGLSFRSWRILEQFADPNLQYVEADLPEMTNWKSAKLTSLRLRDKRLTVVPINILRTKGALSPGAVLRKTLDISQPKVVVTEGLVNYFSLDTIQDFWRRLALQLGASPGSSYLFEIWPRLPVYEKSLPLRLGIKTIEMLTQQQVPLHFQSTDEIRSCLLECGFRQVEVLDPRDFAEHGIYLFKLIHARI